MEDESEKDERRRLAETVPSRLAASTFAATFVAATLLVYVTAAPILGVAGLITTLIVIAPLLIGIWFVMAAPKPDGH